MLCRSLITVNLSPNSPKTMENKPGLYCETRALLPYLHLTLMRSRSVLNRASPWGSSSTLLSSQLCILRYAKEEMLLSSILIVFAYAVPTLEKSNLLLPFDATKPGQSWKSPNLNLGTHICCMSLFESEIYEGAYEVDMVCRQVGKRSSEETCISGSISSKIVHINDVSGSRNDFQRSCPSSVKLLQSYLSILKRFGLQKATLLDASYYKLFRDNQTFNVNVRSTLWNALLTDETNPHQLSHYGKLGFGLNLYTDFASRQRMLTALKMQSSNFDP